MFKEEMSAKDWVDRINSRAEKDFENHQLKVIGSGYWRIRNPDNSSFWADIIVIGNNSAISVWGDIDGCFFAYCSGAEKPEDVVAWMAKADISYYGRQKASIGMGGIGVETFRSEVAVYQLRQRLEMEKEECQEEWEKYKDHWEGGIERAITLIANGETEQTIYQELIDCLRKVDQDPYEWITDIGKVPSTRVIYCLAAIRKLNQLL